MNEKRTASLDVDAVIVRPLEETIEARPSKALPTSLEVNGKVVSAFDDVPLGQEQRFLTLSGVVGEPSEFTALDRDKMQSRIYQMDAIEFCIRNIENFSLYSEDDKQKVMNFSIDLISGSINDPRIIVKFMKENGGRLHLFCDLKILYRKVDFSRFAFELTAKAHGWDRRMAPYGVEYEEEIKKYRIKNYYAIPPGVMVKKLGISEIVESNRDYYMEKIGKKITIRDRKK